MKQFPDCFRCIFNFEMVYDIFSNFLEFCWICRFDPMYQLLDLFIGKVGLLWFILEKIQAFDALCFVLAMPVINGSYDLPMTEATSLIS